MKELEVATQYIEEYGVTVNRYLTNDQIQQIVKAAKQAKSWAERQENIEMLVLLFATDMSKEQLEQYDVNLLKQSGFIDKVQMYIKNLYEIEEALTYEESLIKALFEISKSMPELIKPIQGVAENHAKAIGK